MTGFDASASRRSLPPWPLTRHFFCSFFVTDVFDDTDSVRSYWPGFHQLSKSVFGFFSLFRFFFGRSYCSCCSFIRLSMIRFRLTRLILIKLTSLNCVSPSFLGLTGFYRVLPGSTWFYLVFFKVPPNFK